MSQLNQEESLSQRKKSYISLKSSKSSNNSEKISSLFHTSETFPEYCSTFIKESHFLKLNIEEYSLFLENSPSFDLQQEYIKKFVEWILSLNDKLANLDKVTYQIMYFKLLGISLIFKTTVTYQQFSIIVDFFYKSLKLQDFKQLKEEFMDCLFILIQNFHFLYLEKIEKQSNFSLLGEYMLIKCMCFMTIHNYQDFTYDFGPLIIKTARVIGDIVCTNLVLKQEKIQDKTLFLNVFKKMTKLLDFFSNLEEEQSEIVFLKEKSEFYDSFLTWTVYLMLLENDFDFVYKNISQITKLEEIIKCEKKQIEEKLAVEIFKKEIDIFRNSEKKKLYEKDEIIFLKNLERVFHVNFYYYLVYFIIFLDNHENAQIKFP